MLVWSPAALFEASFQMTFLAIIAIGGIAIPLAERSFLPYAHAAKDLEDKWIDGTLPPRVAQFRLMLRLWSEAIANLLGKWAAELLPLSAALDPLGLGVGADRRRRRNGDGAADGSLLPSRNHVRRPHQYVERAVGRHPCSHGRRHILRVPRQPLVSDAAGCERPLFCCTESPASSAA